MLGSLANVHLALLGRDELNRSFDRLCQCSNNFASACVRAKVLDLVRDLARYVVAQALQLFAIRRANACLFLIEFLAAFVEGVALGLRLALQSRELFALFEDR